ncbi:nuclear architecture related protein [Scheffersomyces stipitis CBS 6054]|uniref:Cytosolic Fe-S cluster assembly factor NAR1 n=1 Tax=Scheffersomyces stipitis (strain ATCC 58785 / CBS 6054 / NBRC 10063 / NRRL Y-11545) TaxID=322104 RepID=NAR1_PICST|nr:nuclear architecture related protein [Scheffersomyces stipitis CBS 6054]A3LYR2.2 RecName: Full=Cytosolic Fe-S cluster assembly factor NAR1; AltName: Full=Nuclear architecture-related protein 1 [Scheffersomyces stipitis CBS 6054]ABN68216.2 nuclear architecture related protein [Scheffersomyces stipitis CBS 6054]KAG2731455.1 hypothetical protein G9P44_005871 [Scheffersomyces stipitis]
MSAILSADDLNDFISPGVACIKPPAQNSDQKFNSLNENGEVEIQIDSEGNPLEISKIDGKQTNLSPAQISLADCLACSGCITSAEEVLVAQHSHEELIKALNEKVDNNSTKVFVASISHQSRASLATAYNLSIEEIDKLLINLFINQMGFKYIVGTSIGRKLSLINEAQNLIEKKESEFDGPVLSSICPGWVLYAEKTHPYVLPRMSTVKSPQQITGCLLKTLAAHELGVTRNDIYHLSIMPCFDKKLESARPEKYGEQNTSNDVDCVLTAKELVTLLEQHSDKFQLIPPQAHTITNSAIPVVDLYSKCAPRTWPLVQYSWSNDSGSASGGYGYNYLKMYQNHLIMKHPTKYQQEGFSIDYVKGRNTDLTEMRLMYGSEKLASSAIVNGFRNIQNLVRKLKPTVKPGSTTGKGNALVARRRARVAGGITKASSPAGSDESADASKCDYVEIMACPNGCINGGGQINPPEDVSEKDWLSASLEKYNSIPLLDLAAMENVDTVAEIMQWSCLFREEFGVSENRLLKTWFNEVEKPTDSASILLGARW